MRKLFGEKLFVLNVGLEHFYHELAEQGVRVVHVEYRPPPKLEKDIEEILSKII